MILKGVGIGLIGTGFTGCGKPLRQDALKEHDFGRAVNAANQRRL
jgi:hypothetical protein